MYNPGNPTENKYKKDINQISVCRYLGETPVQIRLEPDGSLSLKKLMEHFPRAVNIQYLIDTDWYVASILDGQIQEPSYDSGGWNCCQYYYCIMTPASYKTERSQYHYSVTSMKKLRRKPLCQIYYRQGFCMKQLRQDCHFVHGDFCKYCRRYALHPFDDDYRRQHENQCRSANEFRKININDCPENNVADDIYPILVNTTKICPKFEHFGYCNQQSNQSCSLIHGDKCDYCDRYVLHPFNEYERNKHVERCLNDYLGRNTCAICLESIGNGNRSSFDNNILELIESDRLKVSMAATNQNKSGRMINCRHVFCLSCIETWRRTSQSFKCPICRVPSQQIIENV